MARLAHWLAVAAAVVLALFLRLWGMTWGLQDANVSTRPHPDEWTIYWLFRWFSRNHSLNPCPHPGSQCFFDWGAAYPYAGYAVRAALSPVFSHMSYAGFGPRADPGFLQTVLAGRITSIALSAVTVVLIYLIARLAAGRAAGLAAAFAAAVSGLLIQLAHFATQDSTTIFFMTAALLALVLAVREPSVRRLAAAGLICGLAVGSEYHMALLVCPLVAAWWIGGNRTVPALSAAVALMVAGWALVNPFAIVEFSAFVDASLHTLSIRTVNSSAEYGDRWAAYGPAWLYVVRYPLGYAEGLFLTAWLLAGAAWGVVRRRDVDLVLLAWLVPYFVLVTLSPAKFMRYSAPLLPPLCVFAGVFLADLLRRIPSPARLAAVAVAGLITLYTLTGDAAYAQLFTHADSRLVAARWLQGHAPEGSRVSFEELPNGLINAPYFFTQAGFRPCFTQFRAGRLAGAQQYLVLDNYDLEEHPRVRTTQVQNFRAALLRDPAYRLVYRVAPVPAFLGLKFPIAASPHDWRYPAHVISIYRHGKPGGVARGACFSSMARATAALYPPLASGR
jgi:hypothetical protein